MTVQNYRIVEQTRHRRACANAQSRQSLRCSQNQSMDVDEGSDPNLDLYWWGTRNKFIYFWPYFSRAKCIVWHLQDTTSSLDEIQMDQVKIKISTYFVRHIINIYCSQKVGDIRIL